MDIIEAIPHEGPWRVAGSERDYDWIGPDSTIPFAGSLFRAFDRWVPFTNLIRRFRKLAGAGGDSFDGTHGITVADCGSKLHTMGLTFTRDGDTFKNVRNIEGTIHTFHLLVKSATEMVGRFTFEITKGTSPIPPESLIAMEDAGIDPAIMDRIHMESDRPMTWRFVGTEKQAEESRKKIAACSCERAFRSALSARIMAELFGDQETIQEAIDRKLDWDEYKQQALVKHRPVIEYLYPMVNGDPPSRAEGQLALEEMNHDTTKVETLASVSNEQPWFVQIEDTETWNRLPRVVQQSVAVHETMHQAQNRAHRSRAVGEDVAGPGLGVQGTDQTYPEIVGATPQMAHDEHEAHAAQFEFLRDWIAENCGDCDGCERWSAERLPDVSRSLLQEALAAPTSSTD